ncbi:MAG: hypothetical protein V5B39_09895 [Accumulibacter sp.]|uniref:hypothetical protein n=1 Tax=Accumulibacter sp. TaxID=2053492 RepID=UPI002FC38D80
MLEEHRVAVILEDAKRTCPHAGERCAVDPLAFRILKDEEESAWFFESAEYTLQGFLQGGGTVTGFNLDAPGCLGLAISLKRRLCASAANLESEQF